MTDWKIYHGKGKPDAKWLERLPAPPPWRRFDPQQQSRATTFQPPPQVIEMVNAALYLRRPILVTGQPGTGKSSLCYAVAHELGLGQVLTWHVNSRSSLQDGLYNYDALGRLRQASLEKELGPGKQPAASVAEDIGRFVTLGPLGTAFLAEQSPRAVLIDEIDKSDIDLPNDLLHVLEDGRFEIRELARHDVERVAVRNADGKPVEIHNGLVTCRVFPFVVITSNGERDLPPAFLRRCLQLDIPQADPEQLALIAKAHLPAGDAKLLAELITDFDQRRQNGDLLATDQLLNLFYLLSSGRKISQDDRQQIEKTLLRSLGLG
jgi:MoxR-like ATPase